MEKLEELRGHLDTYKSLCLMTAEADEGAVFPVDMLSMAVTHRAMCLITGFSNLIECKNFICAAPLVRLMLDNLLRFYAVWLVDKPHDFATEIIRGIQVGKIKDRSGNRMTDRYLADQLSKEYEWIPRLYRETSGYIHLSSKHYFNTIKECDGKSRELKFAIGDSDTCIRSEFYDEAVEAMLAISAASMKYLHGWGYTKAMKSVSTRHCKV